MEQFIQLTSSGKSLSDAFRSTDPLTKNNNSGVTARERNLQSGSNEEDQRTLLPFFQFLNQQMSLQEKSSDNVGLNIDGKEITQEQAMLLLPGDISLKELQQALADLVQSGDTAEIDPGKNGQPAVNFNAWLKEMDFLKNNLTGGDAKKEVSAGENDTIAAIIAGLDKEINIKIGENENEQKTISENDILRNQAGLITSGDRENKFVAEIAKSPDASIKKTGVDLKNAIATPSNKAENNSINIQPQRNNETGDNEIQGEAAEKEAQSVLKTDAQALQSGKILLQEAQLSESNAGKITVNLTEGREENKTRKDIPFLKAGEEDNNTHSNSRLSVQEIKETQAGKDNLRFADDQYSNAAKGNAANKAQSDTMQTILSEVSGKIKADQKAATGAVEKNNEEFSLISGNTASSGTVNSEKNNTVLPDKIISQVTSEIKEAAANDGGRVKITLNPPSLGKLDMDVSIRNGKVEVVLVAENKDVQQALNTHIDKLKGGLQNQGLTIERCDVFLQDKREEYQQSFSQQAFNHQESSGRDSRRENNYDEEVKAAATIPERPGNVLRTSTDNISLFA
ncbi:MAG: Flagellar hook-length control protein FliK [Smithella sp. PtaU1.Bin162]|nr:MAG: Flagellar hook-length control protein FliK [Smithella sp. PtaU1.Bin162]